MPSPLRRPTLRRASLGRPRRHLRMSLAPQPAARPTTSPISGASGISVVTATRIPSATPTTAPITRNSQTDRLSPVVPQAISQSSHGASPRISPREVGRRSRTPGTQPSQAKTLHYGVTFVNDSQIDLGARGPSVGDE